MVNDELYTPIGYFKVKTLLWYDGPRVAILSNHHGEKYLGYLVDELGEFDKWFVVPASEGRVRSIQNGSVSIKDAITSPEKGWLFEMLLPTVPGEEGTCEQLTPEKISLQDLPGQNSFLEMSGGKNSESR